MNRDNAGKPGNDTAHYSFVSTWRPRVDATTLWSTIGRSVVSHEPIVWWPALGARREADRISMTVRSVFGYRLQVVATRITMDSQRLTFDLGGDIVGAGIVRLSGSGDDPRLIIEMTVATVPRWMNRGARTLRPAFVAGHRLVMWRGSRRFNRWLVASAGSG